MKSYHFGAKIALLPNMVVYLSVNGGITERNYKSVKNYRKIDEKASISIAKPALILED